MKKLFFLLSIIAIAFTTSAQYKVAILEPVDKAQNVNYGVKLLLRSSLTSAISNTDGFEGYDRVDMASISGEQEFQRTGNVSDNQIRQIGKAAGASYVLVAEAAKYDATSIIITAKLLDVETFGIKSSAVLVSGIKAEELQESCITLASKLLSISPSPAIAESVEGEGTDSQANNESSQSDMGQRQQNEAVKYDGKQEKDEYDEKEYHVIEEEEEPEYGNVGSLVSFPDQTKGIVFYRNNGLGLVIALDASEQQWHTADSRRDYHDISHIPNNDEDYKNFIVNGGNYYTKAIVSELPTGSAPAAEWCVMHGTGWYLPRAGELMCLLKVVNENNLINKALKRAGGVIIEDGWYWSSSECDTKEALAINIEGKTSSEKKKSRQKVRAIKAFTY